MIPEQYAKKLCSLLCAGLLLTACAQAEGAPSANATGADAEKTVVAATEASSAKTRDAAAATTETSAETRAEDVNEVNLPAEDVSFIRFSNKTQKTYEAAEDNERAVVRVTCDLLEIEKTASDGETSLNALARKVSEAEYKRKQERDAGVRTYMKKAEARNRQEKYDCDIRQQLSVLRADTRVLSWMEENSRTVDTAGASPEDEEDTYSCVSYNFDAKTAKALRLTDVVKDTGTLSRLAADAVLEKYDTTNPAYNASAQFEGIDLQKNILALLESEDGTGEAAFAWAPAYFGLRLVFSREALCGKENLEAYLDEASEINPRDRKRFDITIPYTGEPSLFETAYTELPVSYFARLESGVTYFADFGNGPELLQITTPRKYENRTVLYTGECTIRLGENGKQSFDLISTEEYGNLGVCAYLVRQPEACYLYVDVTGKDDTDRLHVYAIGDGTVRFAGVSEEMLDNDHLPPFDPAHFMTEGVFYILPDPFVPDAYTGNRGFRESFVSAGGMPASRMRFYTVAEEDVRVTATDLELDTLTDADDIRPVKESYAAGTALSMWRIERASHADFKTDNGRMVRLYINGVDTIDLIDGHELREAFADPRLSSGE